MIQTSHVAVQEKKKTFIENTGKPPRSQNKFYFKARN
jgi:hypothetical protein